MVNWKYALTFLLTGAILIGYWNLITSVGFSVDLYYAIGAFLFLLVTFAFAEWAGFHDEEERRLRNAFVPFVNIPMYWIADLYSGQRASLSVGFGGLVAVLVVMAYMTFK